MNNQEIRQKFNGHCIQADGPLLTLHPNENHPVIVPAQTVKKIEVRSTSSGPEETVFYVDVHIENRTHPVVFSMDMEEQFANQLVWFAKSQWFTALEQHATFQK